MSIQTLVSDFASQIESFVRQDVERRVRELLSGVLGRRGPGRPPKGTHASSSKPAKSTPSKPVSAKQARQRKLQGIYLGTIRHLKAGDRAKVMAVAKTKGVAAAVAFSKKFKK